VVDLHGGGRLVGKNNATERFQLDEARLYSHALNELSTHAASFGESVEGNLWTPESVDEIDHQKRDCLAQAVLLSGAQEVTEIG
jgi:hypothetical protein